MFQASHLSGLSLLGNLSLPAGRHVQDCQGYSFVHRWKTLEVQGPLVVLAAQVLQSGPEDQEERDPDCRCLPSDLSLLGSLVVQMNHLHHHLEFLPLQEVLVNLANVKKRRLCLLMVRELSGSLALIPQQFALISCVIRQFQVNVLQTRSEK